MDELTDFIRRGLQASPAHVRHHVQTKVGVLDLVLHGTNTTYVIEYATGSPDPSAIARLFLYRERPKILSEAGVKVKGDVVGVLVAPAFTKTIQDLALDAGVQVLRAPLDLLPSAPPRRIPLTTAKAWDVVVASFRVPPGAGTRAIAKEARTSAGWTSAVLRTLSTVPLFGPNGERAANALPSLLDRVASERPLKRLERARIPTGIQDWDELQETLQAQKDHIDERLKEPGVWVCGQTAAMQYTGYIQRHDRFQVYANDPEGLARFFQGRQGGIELVVYEPDRELPPVDPDGPWPTVSLEQTLLDVAGMGYAARDTATRLVEALRA